jgi:sugar lactone lactonase YvrE
MKKYPVLSSIIAVALGVTSLSVAASPASADGAKLAVTRVAGYDITSQTPDAAGVAVASDGTVFIADRGADRIVKIAPLASTWTLLTSSVGAGDGLDQVNEPTSLTIDANDNLYISDAGNNRVLKWAFGASAATVVAGTSTVGSGLNQLNYPAQTAFGADGEMYVADAGNNRIMRFDTQGPGVTGTVVAGDGTSGADLAHLSAPLGVAVGAGSNPDIYVADTDNHRVIKFVQGVTDGVVVTGDGTAGSDEWHLNRPSSLLLSGTDLYIVDSENHRVQVQTSAGSAMTPAAGDGTFSYDNTSVRAPRSIALVGSQLYIAEYERVTRWEPYNGTGVLLIGPSSAPTALFNSYPSVMRVHTDGGAYIADVDRVVMIDPVSGIPTQLAGGNGYGTGLNQITNAQGVAVDTEGNIFISDADNNRVVKWAPGATTGVIVAGTGTSGAGLDQLSNPSGIDLGPDGSLFITDTANSRVVKWVKDPQTGEYASAGVVVAGTTFGFNLDQLGFPNDVRVMNDETVVIADTSNHRVVKWAPGATTGVVIAGGNGGGFAANQTWAPMFIALDQVGGVYVSSMSSRSVTYWAANATEGVALFDAMMIGRPTGVDVDATGRAYAVDSHYLGIVAQTLDANLSFGSMQDRMLGSGDVTLSLSKRAGSYPTMRSTTPLVCSLAGDVVTLIKTGTCSIIAEMAGPMWETTSAYATFVVTPVPTTTTTPPTTTEPPTTTPPTTTPPTTTPPTTTVPPVTTTTPPATTTPVTLPPANTLPPAPAVPALAVKCSASGKTVRCVASKPKAVAKKAKVSYSTVCVAPGKKKTKSASSAGTVVVLVVKTGSGTWSCTTTAKSGASKWAKTTAVKVK